LGRDVRCLVLDTDIHISPFAENIFRSVEPNKIGVVSQYSGLPMDYRKIRNRAAWFRKMFWDEGFPLSSMLTATPADCFRGAQLGNQYEELFCAGLFVVETSRHAQFLVDTYDSAPVGNPNYYAYSTWEELWLNYTWHALWLYEMVMYYPFLYSAEASQELCHWCLATSLLRNNFVHLAGGWESQVFKGPPVADLYGPRGFNEWVRSLGAHDDTPLEGVSRGYIVGPE
jgi:hypothetical protein